MNKEESEQEGKKQIFPEQKETGQRESSRRNHELEPLTMSVETKVVPGNVKKTLMAGKDTKIVALYTESRTLKSVCVLCCRNKCCDLMENTYILTTSIFLNVAFFVLLLYILISSKHFSANDGSNETIYLTEHTDSAIYVSCVNAQTSHFSRRTANKFCCVQNQLSLSFLLRLMATEHKRHLINSHRQPTKDFMLLYFPTHRSGSKERNALPVQCYRLPVFQVSFGQPFLKLGCSDSHTRLAWETKQDKALKSDSMLVLNNKFIVQESGKYIIFAGLTTVWTRERHEDTFRVEIKRYHDSEETLMSAIVRSAVVGDNTNLIFKTSHLLDSFTLTKGDSLSITVHGNENLYLYKQSNYFGLYRYETGIQ